MNLQLICDGTPGLNAGFTIQAQDSSGNHWPATGTATIDQYSLAFVQSVGVGNDEYQIIPKVTFAPGQPTVTVNVTFQCVDSASGIAIPPLVVSVDLVAPPPPAQKATQLVITGGPGEGTGSDLTDPGSATIPVSLV